VQAETTIQLTELEETKEKERGRLSRRQKVGRKLVFHCRERTEGYVENKRDDANRVSNSVLNRRGVGSSDKRGNASGVACFQVTEHAIGERKEHWDQVTKKTGGKKEEDSEGKEKSLW